MNTTVKKIREETYVSNDVEMIKEFYGYLDDNGNEIIITTKTRPNIELTEPEEEPLTEQEQIAIDTALTVEYMACLLEASLT